MDPLQQDQEDILARLQADDYFGNVSVLLERRGNIENDIAIALSTLNEKNFAIGAVAVVLMPSLQPGEPDAPGPEYFVEQQVQVISQALMNAADAGGTGKTAEDLAQRVRQLLHRWESGLGTWSFTRMEPLPGNDPGKVSYVVTFRRTAMDEGLAKCGLPLIDPDTGAAPQEVTLTTGTAGAQIWYTLDGSLPTPTNPQARRYYAAFTVAAAATLRAVAYKPDHAASNVAAATFS